MKVEYTRYSHPTSYAAVSSMPRASPTESRTTQRYSTSVGTHIRLISAVAKSKHTHTVIRRLPRVTQQTRNLRHRLDPNNSLDSEVRLIRQRPREVVGAELVIGDEGVFDEELIPLI